MEKLKEIMLKSINIKTTYLLGLIVISFMLVVLCFSYAIFTATEEKRGVLNIVTGNLYPSLVSSELDSNNQITIASGEVKSFTITLQNINSIDAKVNLYYEIVSGDSSLVDIGYVESTKDLPPDNNGYVIEKYGSNNEKKITVGINNTGTSSVTIKFGTNVGLSNAALAMPSNSYALSLVTLPEPLYTNENILAAYTYDPTNTETLCIIGEESTCKNATAFDQGTIVKYKVNASESYYFYVLHDDGSTLTMQQRENTLEAQWYSADPGYDNNTYGPTGAIPALEEETADWNNVNDQTYTMGTTVFGNADNAYTGCGSYTSCTTNKYTWASRTGKARMITLQEAVSTGCTTTQKSCPIWMYNYLKSSASYGGTVNGTVNNYWTMSAYSSNARSALIVSSYGRGNYLNVTYAYGVRAVVVVNK